MTNSPPTGGYREFWDRFEKQIDQRSDTPLYFDEDELESNYLPQKRNLPDGINYTFVSNANQGHLQVKFHIHDRRSDRTEIYEYLDAHRQEIESEIGAPLKWNERESYDKIILQRDGDVLTDFDAWNEYIDWFIEYGERFDEVFGRYLERYQG